MAFFGLYGTTSALATTLALSSVVSCIGIGFQRGTHSRWQLVSNDASGAPTLTDMGASFAIATGGVLTLTIAASPNAGSFWVRVIDEVSGAVFEQEVTSDLPAGGEPVPQPAALHEQRRDGPPPSPTTAQASTLRQTSDHSGAGYGRGGASTCLAPFNCALACRAGFGGGMRHESF